MTSSKRDLYFLKLLMSQQFNNDNLIYSKIKMNYDGFALMFSNQQFLKHQKFDGHRYFQTVSKRSSKKF